MDDSKHHVDASLTSRSMIVAGVRYNWRAALSVALGVAVATAVIVGALLVGDSMRGSLRELTVERLGKVVSVVAPGGFFDADSIDETLGLDRDQTAAIILFDRAVIETVGEQAGRRAGAVQTIGCDESFWKMDVSGVAPKTIPDDQSVVLTQSVADELGVAIGDLVTVRLPVEQAVPADSPLGRRDVQTEGIPRLKVAEIIPDRGLARFSLAPAQASPKNVFLSRSLVASVLSRDGQANVALASRVPDPKELDVSLADQGLQLERVTKTFENETVFDYYSLTSDRMMLGDAATEAILGALPDQKVTQALTYLANEIARVDGLQETPIVTYSTITAMDSTATFPLEFGNRQPQDNSSRQNDVVPMVINSWLAERLDATEGTKLRITYFQPEVENGNEVELGFDAVVTSVVPVTEPARRYFRSREAVFDQRPTIYNDPHLTPTVPGVTDQDSMSDWDTPFELTRTVPKEDDDYWKNHRLTPKAFIPLADGQRLFGSRFGKRTGLRIDPELSDDVEQLEQRLVKATKPNLAAIGWHIRDLRESQLAASKGTTPFDGLFLSLSFFVIFAAVMLIAMLFRLGLVARSKELGTLMALGLQRKQVSRLLLGEGILIAAMGVLLGVAGGIGYASFVLYALRTFWVGAVTVPFLTFHANAMSLILGGVTGLVIGLITLWWTLRSMLQNLTVQLLRGQDQSDQVGTAKPTSPLPMRLAIGLVVMAVVAGIAGAMSGGQTAAGAFVGGGMLLLFSVLLIVFERLKRSRSRKPPTGGYSIWRLAGSNSARSPLRSTLTIGLMATASFLIVAITAFRLQPSDDGTGKFDLIADSAQPLYEDLTDTQVQTELLGNDSHLLDEATLVSMRVRSGQDASCNNLYQATEPTVFGVPSSAANTLSDFRFYSSAATKADQTPWTLLARRASGSREDPIPVILDQNTAMWSLQMIKGIGERKSFVYDNSAVHFEVVGLLENSVLQGRLLVGEANFQTIFPDVNGYRFFLIQAGSSDAETLAAGLETRLGDTGFDTSDARQVLSGMMAVQNTYLRTFQSLGGLGLLLGTIGLAIAQVRNVLQRRSELAVMRAIGFTPSRLAAMVLGETATLLLVGVGCGVLCAIVAVLPHAISNGIVPPVIEPVLLVGGIVVFGLLAGIIASRKVVTMHLLDSLRAS